LIATPARPSADGRRLRPWLALVVLDETEFTDATNVMGRPLPYIEVPDPATTFPPADELWAWAHVHVNGGLDDLERAMHAVDQGKVYISPSVESTIVESLGTTSSTPEDKLTRREIEVLQLLAEGKSTKRIAEILSVSAKTVETHRLHIMAKLKLYSVAELTKYAIRQGITTDTA